MKLQSLYRSFDPGLWRSLSSRDKGNVIWFHCASTGETKSIAPVVELVKRRYPSYNVIITNRSCRALQWPIPEVDAIAKRVLAPNELRVDEFLNRVKPNVAVFVESELWPRLIMQTRQRVGNKLALINGRISQRSFERWQTTYLSKRLVGSMLKCFHSIHAQSADDAERFRILLSSEGDCNREITIGNLKTVPAKSLFTQIPADPEIAAFLQQHQSGWAAVSTHPGEEQILLQAQIRLKNAAGPLVIIPRHPDPLAKAITPLGEQVFQINRMNSIHKVSEWVALGPVKLVFVGGSLSASQHKGGHNILEPLSCGCLIAHGPHMQAFTDVVNGVPPSLRFEVDDVGGLVNAVIAAQGIQVCLRQACEEASRVNHEATLDVVWKSLDALLKS